MTAREWDGREKRLKVVPSDSSGSGGGSDAMPWQSGGCNRTLP